MENKIATVDNVQLQTLRALYGKEINGTDYFIL